MVRAQLETTRQTKTAAEQTSAEHAESTAQLRVEIKLLMEQVEHKDQQMRENKARDKENELEVKKLREDALAARKQLELMSKREPSILENRDTAIATRKKAEIEITTLEEALEGLKRRNTNDVKSLRESLAHLKTELAAAAARGVRLTGETEGNVLELLEKRRKEIERLQEAQKRMEKNSAEFVESIRGELEALQHAVNESGQRSEAYQDRVKGAKLELTELLRKIRTFKEDEAEKEKAEGLARKSEGSS